MKAYVILCAIAGYISGAPIYYRNKIKYLKERGYEVFVFPVRGGEIFIDDLREYAGRAYPFLEDYPPEYSEKDRNALVESMAREIPECDEITVETGSDYTGYWGELLAKRLGARHFQFLLDEKNPRISGAVMPYFEFKYKRRELACITGDTLQNYFENSFEIQNADSYALKAVCTNSTEDYDSPITDEIPKNAYMLGYIGRPSKSFFEPVLDGVIAFAEDVSPERVTFTVFGGDGEEVLSKIRERCTAVSNLDLFITGYMFPFPEKAIKLHGMFISGAGSRFVSARLGVPTLSMDVYRNRPFGMVTDNSQAFTRDDYDGRSVFDYIRQILIDKNIPETSGLEPITWDYVTDAFDRHAEFLSRAEKSLEYYPTEALPLNKKQKAFKTARTVLGNKGFEKLRKTKQRF